MDTDSTKAALRAQFRTYREGLSDDAYHKRSAAIRGRLASLPELRRAQTIHSYWPLTDAREVDTRPLLRRLHNDGRQIVLPKVVNFQAPDGTPPRMTHLRFEGEQALRPNRWGICEPTSSQRVSLGTLDAVVVPALGAGHNGHRIGHGLGFYDAFLRTLSVPTLCLVYAACLVDEVPAAPHDVPVSAIITERDMLRPDT